MQSVNPLIDLAGIVAVAASAATMLRILYLVLRHRQRDGRRLLRRWGYCAAGYLLVSVAASAVRPTRSIGLMQRWCFDDWCLSVDRVTRRASSTDTTYTLDLQAYNAGRLPQRALYPWMFVRDADGRRYQSMTKDWAAQVSAAIAPQASNRFAVEFVLPSHVEPVAFVTNHGSGTPCSLVPSLLFISQGGCLFGKYDSIRLQ